MLIWIKTYAKLIWSGLLFVGGAVLSFLLMQSRSNRKEKKRIKAQYEHAKKVMQKDVEIELEFDERTERLKDEVEKKKSSSELSNPNDW